MSMRTKSLLLAILAVLLLAGCGSGSPPQPGQPTSTSAPGYSAAATPTPTPGATPIGPLGAPNCQPASPIDNSPIGPEAEGTSANASLWALLMSTSGIPIQAKQGVKIVWRMTGSGDLQLVAIGPQGQRLAPTWGPDAHGGSNWNRPGDEWGAGFNLPTAGCWDLHASRDNASGDLWLVVTS